VFGNRSRPIGKVVRDAWREFMVASISRTIPRVSPARKQRIARLTRRLGDVWGVRLAGLIVVRNPRLRTTLARYLPLKRRLELSTAAARARHPERVVVHELAHAAAVDLYGRKVRPHGKEWAALVERAELAGFLTATPRQSSAKSLKKRSSSSRFEHVCPICHFRRIAKRRVTTWRCPDCRAAGLPGDLDIEKLA
jgi:predicted SprT family Zn-dependent metalloprotease